MRQIVRVHFGETSYLENIETSELLSRARRWLGVTFSQYRFVRYNKFLNTKTVLNDERYEATKRLEDGFILPDGSILLASMEPSGI